MTRLSLSSLHETKGIHRNHGCEPSHWPNRPESDHCGHQELTREWWDEVLPLLGGCISDLVLEEASDGDATAAAKRLEALKSIPVLLPGKTSIEITEAIMASGLVPDAYVNDAVHVAIAAANGIEFLVTWNCKHLANAWIRTRLVSLIESLGYRCPVICTPEELMEAPQ